MHDIVELYSVKEAKWKYEFQEKNISEIRFPHVKTSNCSMISGLPRRQVDKDADRTHGS